MSDANELPEILTVEEVAAELRMPVTTIRAMLRRDEIHGVCLARRWRIRRDAIESLFVAQAAAPTARPGAREVEPVVVDAAPRVGRVGRPPRRRRENRPA